MQLFFLDLLKHPAVDLSGFFIKVDSDENDLFAGIHITPEIIPEGVLILRSISLKYETVADNAILPNISYSSENISKRIKTKTKNGFHLKRNFPQK